MSITDAQYSVLGNPNGLTRCQDDILKDLLKKMTRTYPLGALNIELLPALTKCPVPHAILSYHPFESQSACK
jgi:hypothetical protein